MHNYDVCFYWLTSFRSTRLKISGKYHFPLKPASSETKPLNLETYFISSNDPFGNRFHVVGPTKKKGFKKKKRVLFEKYLGQIVFILLEPDTAL